MSKRFSPGSYVDVKNSDKEWCVGKVSEVKQDLYTIRLDGYLYRHDISVEFDSPRLAPFRQHTRGYTGPPSTLRDDQTYELDKLEEVLTLVKAFTQKEYDQFTATSINSNLRGRIFFFIDTFFTKRSVDLSSTKFLQIIEFLVKVLELIVLYLKKFPSHLFPKFEEGIFDSQKIAQKTDVAYSHFVFEALDTLAMMFGLSDRYSTFFNSPIDETFSRELKQVYKDPNIITDKVQNGALNSTTKKQTYKEIISETLINRFAALNGFEYLIKVIHAESHKARTEDPEALMAPLFILSERLLTFFRMIFQKIQHDKKEKILIKFQQLIFLQIERKTDHCPKILNLKKLAHLFDEIIAFFEELDDPNLKFKFFKDKEIFELTLFLKFLKSSKLEDRLFGLSKIEEYMNRIEISLNPEFLTISEEKLLHYFDRGSFLDWILTNKVFDFIYNKSQHGDLIRKSLEIQRFIAQNNEFFPEELIEIIWNSSLNSNEEVTKVIYEGIIQLAPHLDLKSAQAFFSKFPKVKVKDNGPNIESFALLICQFTEHCLPKILIKSRTGFFKIKDEIPKEDPNFAFGIPLMFEMIMDDYPISPAVSQTVLTYFLKFLNDCFAVKLFLKYFRGCEHNIKKQISLYQSLTIMEGFFTQIQAFDIHGHEFPAKFYDQTITEDLISHILVAYNQYWTKVREKLRTIKKTHKEDIRADKFLTEHFAGKFSHESNVSKVLTVLQKISLNPFKPQPLSFKQLENLWQVFVIKSNFDFETKLFLETLCQQDDNHFVFKEDELIKIFTFIICDSNYFNPKNFTPEKYKCFEFFFLLVNEKDKRLQFQEKSQQQSIQVLNSDLLGLEVLWKNFLECQDRLVSQDFANLLIDVHTNATRKEFVDIIFTKTQTLLQEKNLDAIEKCFWLLERIALLSDDQTIKTDLSDGLTSKDKTTVQVKFYPYNHLKQYDLHPKEKLAHVKLMLAQEFDIQPHEFDLMIEDEVIADQSLKEQLGKHFYYEGITLLKRNVTAASELPLWELLGTQPYIQQIFFIFESFDLERQNSFWNFFKHISLQMENIQDPFSMLTPPFEMNSTNVHQIYYLTSIIQKLVLIDPYYWKMNNLDLKIVKSEWAAKFVSQGKLASLIDLVTNTDIKKINSPLFIKTFFQIYQILHFFAQSFQETASYWNENLFCKTLDVYLYSAKYISTEINLDLHLLKEIIQEYGELTVVLRQILEDMLNLNNNFCRSFLLYVNLKNLYLEVFINLTHSDNYHLKPQEQLKALMNTFFETLKNFPEKQLSNKMFKILFENITIAAIDSQKPANLILQYMAEILSEYDLKKDFDCTLDISFLISQIIQQLKKDQDQDKIASCFSLLYQYLQSSEHALQTLSDASLELAKEILTNGLFRIHAADHNHKPKYQSQKLVDIAFNLLALLTKNLTCFKYVGEQLLNIHQEGVWRKHTYSSWSLSSKPKKKTLAYSGLKNLGCICYMNSTIQQLFLIPEFHKAILDSKSTQQPIDDNTTSHLKKLFYGMKLSAKEYYNPKLFCLSFKGIDGRPTNIREQKDAFEFLSLLLDRLEENVKTTAKNKNNFIKDLFGGSFANKIICKDCPHSYSSEEAYMGVNLVVKNTNNIQESLQHFIQDQTLAGDDAYFCEKCNKKVRATKHVLFKSLPQYIIFGLNRFEYDVYKNIRIKLNDYYEFSQELDLAPYTQEYHSTSDPEEYLYQLKGVVVHAGGAESGHYFSIIKDPVSDHEPRWIEFNDTHVSEFDIKNLPKAAFGDITSSRSAQSAYILVYERKHKTQVKKKVINIKDQKNTNEMEIESISSSLSGEIQKDEFASLQRKISKKNQKLFFAERIFSDQYHEFVINFLRVSQEIIDKEKELTKTSRITKLFRLIWTIFITATLRTGNKEHQQQIFEWIFDALNKNELICRYLLGYFTNTEFFTEMMLQCPRPEPKKLLINLILKSFKKSYLRDKEEKTFWNKNPGTGEYDSAPSNFICFLVNMLSKIKKYPESIDSYFSLLQLLMKNNNDVKKLLLSSRLLGKMAYYLFPSDYIKTTYPNLIAPINVTENEAFLHYNKNSEGANFEDFENPALADFRRFFQVLWHLLKYSRIESRDSYSKFLYHEPSLDYALKEPELKAFQLSSARIEKMFGQIQRTDKKTRRIICKIVAFFSYGSLDDTQASFEFIKNGFKKEKSEKDIEDIFQIIKILCKLNDHFQLDRNRVLLNEILSFIHRQSDQMTLNDIIGILRKLINSNSSFTSILKEKTIYISEIIKTLNNAMEENEPFHRVPNYQLREEVNKQLARHKDYFDDLRTTRKTEFTNDSDSEGDDLHQTNFKKGQNIRYFDPTLKKYFKGVIENVYENLIKVKIITTDTPSYYRWFDDEDSSNITFT